MSRIDKVIAVAGGLIFIGGVCLAGDALADAAAAPVAAPPSAWEKLSGVLLQLLAIVIVVESALSALFQWRLYQMVFNARAWKTPIMFLTGLSLVYTTGYDPMKGILSAVMTAPAEASGWQGLVTSLLSAMIIAGGSSGVYAIFRRLGIRAPEQERDTASLRDDQAYLSIRLTGAPIGVPVHIGIDELEQPADDRLTYLFDHHDLPPFAGTIDTRWFWQRLAGVFMADSMRLPSYGGRKVRTDRYYRIVATWIDQKAAKDQQTRKKGIYRGRFAPRAFVDIHADVSRE